MAASGVKALRVAAEGLSYCVAIVVCESLVPRRVVDLSSEPWTKSLSQQKASLQVEYSSTVSAIEASTAKKLAELLRQKKVSDVESTREFLANLHLFDEGGGSKANLHLFDEGGGSKRLQQPVQRPLDEYRVFVNDEDVRSRYLTFPSVRKGDDVYSSVLKAASDKRLSEAMLLAKWLDLEDMLEANFSCRLAESISPGEAHKAFLATSAAILFAVGATASLFHRVMQSSLKVGSLLALDYNAAALSPGLGLASLFKTVTAEFERRRDEMKKLPWRSRTFWQHLNWDRFTWHPRIWFAVYVILVPSYLVWSFSCENKQRRLLEEQSPEQARAAALVKEKTEALKQRLQRSVVRDDDDDDDDDDDFQSLFHVMEPPYIWPGATKTDPFTAQRCAMAVVEAPVFENLAFRGVVLNRLLTMAGTARFPRALAHVTSVLVAQSPDFSGDQSTAFGLSELEVMVAGLAQAAAAQFIYVSTGSLLLPIVMGAALNLVLLHYEFISRTDFVQQSSWYYRSTTTAVSHLMDANVGRASNYLLHLRHTAWFDTIRLLFCRDVPPMVSDAQIATWASTVMATFASANDSPAEKGQSANARFASMGALRQATATAPRLGAIDLCNLFVALDRALVFAERNNVDNSNAVDFVTLDGSSVVQKRVELEVALSALGADAPALKSFCEYDAIARHLTRHGKPCSANRSPDKMALLEANAPFEAMRDEFMLGCTFNALAAKYPHGLDEAGVAELLTYLLRHCVHPNTVLDPVAFEHSLFGFYLPFPATGPSLHREAFLDLLQGYFQALHEAYVREVALFKDHFGDSWECELVGRQPTPNDKHRLASKMRTMIDAKLRREGVAYLKTFGLTPAAFSRLLRRHSLSHPEIRALEKQWTSFLEGDFQQKQLASFFEREPMWYDVKR